MLNRAWHTGIALVVVVSAAGCDRSSAPPPAATAAAPNPAPQEDFKLWNSRASLTAASPQDLQMLITPGNQTEAEKYYESIRPSLTAFPKPTLPESTIEDMLAYFGFPAIPATVLEALKPDAIMEFAKLGQAVNTPAFDNAYKAAPLQAGEIMVVRFFAPKIISVREPQVNGVPASGGFGWRKVLRFRARIGSDARKAGLDQFYLLFNFVSGAGTAFPESIHAGQIQSMLVPTYPTNGQHRDGYFLVYQGLGTATPGKVGFFLQATFDLAGAVAVPEDKYDVPRACGQCHGTEVGDQKRAKINYLDTDHWIDRTGDDFTNIPAANVLVDGTAAYTTFRALNTEIAAQNREVLKQSGGKPFAALAAEKWLDLHAVGKPNETKHVPPINRGFVENAGDAVWTAGVTLDDELVPLLNQYCFRCHSSVRYHVLQKKEVMAKKDNIVARMKSGNMPQDRKLSDAKRDEILALIDKLPKPQ